MGCLTDLLRGRDPDEIFAYYTTKKIMLKDRRLGLLNKAFMFAILPVEILHYYFRTSGISFSIAIPLTGSTLSCTSSG